MLLHCQEPTENLPLVNQRRGCKVVSPDSLSIPSHPSLELSGTQSQTFEQRSFPRARGPHNSCYLPPNALACHVRQNTFPLNTPFGPRPTPLASHFERAYMPCELIGKIATGSRASAAGVWDWNRPRRARPIVRGQREIHIFCSHGLFSCTFAACLREGPGQRIQRARWSNLLCNLA